MDRYDRYDYDRRYDDRRDDRRDYRDRDRDRYYDDRDRRYDDRRDTRDRYDRPRIKSVDEILRDLENLTIAAELGEMTPADIVRGVENLRDQGCIDIVGRGTNRIVVALKDKDEFSRYIGFREDAVIKIPYALKKGIDDNFRELLLINELEEAYKENGSPEIKYLLDTLPRVSKIDGFNCLIAQERVMPIDQSKLVQSDVRNRGDNITTICTGIILNYCKEQYIKLLQMLDKFCVFADLNPVVTPLQYGFKFNNYERNPQLTILDTGYAMPRFPELKELYRAGVLEPANNVIVGLDVDYSTTQQSTGPNRTTYTQLIPGPNSRFNFDTSQINILRNSLIDKCGMYVARPNDRNPKFIADIDYFFDVFTQLGRIARDHPTSSTSIYYRLLRGQKSQMNKL